MLATVLVLSVLAVLPSAPDVAAVVEILERGVREEQADERLASELAKLGPALIPDLFSVLASGSGLERPLRAAEETALADALASFGSAPLRPYLGRRLSADPPTEERLAALRVLARVGSSEDLALVRLCLQGSGAGIEAALQEACTGILRRDSRALEALRRWMLERPIGIGAAIARAMRESACPQALQALASTLGFRADLDAELLGEIAPLAARARKPVDEDVLEPIEGALEGNDARVLRAAALALGHAQHAEALPALIALLEHESRGVSTAAEWALAHISGLSFHADAQRWRAWLWAEQAWFERHGQRLRGELRARAAEVAIRALGELSSHRWRRHELALTAQIALEHADPRVRRLACTALARLGSSAAQPGLLQALEDADDSVVRAARQALEVLGLAPPDPGPGGDTANLGLPSRNPPSRSRRPQRA